MSKYHAPHILPLSHLRFVSTVVMASLTLYFQRRDERRAALSEVERTTDATGGNHEA